MLSLSNKIGILKTFGYIIPTLESLCQFYIPTILVMKLLDIII